MSETKKRRKIRKTFVKEVVKPGVYWPRDAEGKPYRKEVTAEEIKRWHDDTKRALKNGNQIPMPYVHTAEAVPFLSGQPRPGSYDNGGHLKDVRIREDGVLEAVVEAATPKDAKKFGTSVRNVSFWQKPWTDGKGNEYQDAFRHLALVNHPVHVDQKNFEPYDVPSEGIALSLMMATEPLMIAAPESQNRVESLLKDLEEFGLALPDDTDETNVWDRLKAALKAVLSFKKTQQGEAQQLDNPPKGAKAQQPAPLAMATDNELQFAIETLREHPLNPATQKAWTAAELKARYEAAEASKPKLEFSTEQKAQLKAIQVQAKVPLVQRIENLVRRKVITPTKAQNELMPLLNGTELSFSADGHVKEDTPIHVILSTLESMAPGAALHGREDLSDSVEIEGTKFSLGDGLRVHEPPRGFTEAEDDPEAVTEERKALAERMAKYAAS